MNFNSYKYIDVLSFESEGQLRLAISRITQRVEVISIYHANKMHHAWLKLERPLKKDILKLRILKEMEGNNGRS